VYVPQFFFDTIMGGFEVLNFRGACGGQVPLSLHW